MELPFYINIASHDTKKCRQDQMPYLVFKDTSGPALAMDDEYCVGPSGAATRTGWRRCWRLPVQLGRGNFDVYSGSWSAAVVLKKPSGWHGPKTRRSEGLEMEGAKVWGVGDTKEDVRGPGK